MKKIIHFVLAACFLFLLTLPLTAAECRAEEEVIQWNVKWKLDKPQVMLPTEEFTIENGVLEAVVKTDENPEGETFKMKIQSLSISTEDPVVSYEFEPDGTYRFTALPSGIGKTVTVRLRAKNEALSKSHECRIIFEVVDLRYYLNMDWNRNPDIFVPGQTKALETFLVKYTYSDTDGITVSSATDDEVYRIDFINHSADMISIADGAVTVREREAFETLPTAAPVTLHVTDPSGRWAEYELNLWIMDRYRTIAAEPYWTEKDEVITNDKLAVTVTEYTTDCPEGRTVDVPYVFLRNESTSDAVSIADDGKSVTILSDAEAGEGTYAVDSICVATEDETFGLYCETELPLKICSHEWEITRTEPTYEADGSVVTACPICGKSTTEILEFVPTFTDVTDKNSWYFAPVYWAVENGVTNGMGEGTFQPMALLTRAQAVTFLYNVAGKPDVEGLETAEFSDVPEGAWYYKAVKWAVANKITSGYGQGTFQPYAPCNRAMIVTFLANYVRSAERYVEPTTTSTFTDVKATDWFSKSVDWAVENSITSGYGQGTFSPYVTCNRAMMVTFLKKVAAMMES